jgi:hypothetical protein
MNRNSAMGKKIAPKGSSEEFLRCNVGMQSDECLIWPYRTNNTGYGLAVINGKQKTASRWMCILAHGEPVGQKKHAAHECGNSACVNPNHLTWKTHKENMHDKKRHGTDNIGKRNGKTNLTEDDVIYIRSAPPDLAPLMRKYNMSKHGISKIRSRLRWAHVE